MAAAPLNNNNNVEDDISAKALQKRYEGLVTVRSKAIKGKGAWYWVHLEPILVQNQDTGIAKAVKLRCGLCSALFSASNPSRTASEHLKRGTCPNFNGAVVPRPVQQQNQQPQVAGSKHAKKRSLAAQIATPLSAVYGAIEPLPAPVPPSLSGGKEDLAPLAMLEDSVKKLKSPGRAAAAGSGAAVAGGCPGGGILSRGQAEAAVGLLADWLYESCGTVSFSCVEHPKFRTFLSHVGLPPVSGKLLAGARLDAKYEEVRAESEARLRDALFFQLASDGWSKKWVPPGGASASTSSGGGDSLVNLTMNLPNGTSLFRKAVFAHGSVPPKFVEDTLWEGIIGVCGSCVEKCVGIVADTDRIKSKALIDLEDRNRWMINLQCQHQAFSSLLKDFYKHLPLFRSVAAGCLKLAHYLNGRSSSVRTFFHKDSDQVNLIRTPPDQAYGNFMQAYTMMEDVWNSIRALQLTVFDEAYKTVCSEEPMGREVAEIIRDGRFCGELDAVLSLVKLLRLMIQEMEAERPLVGQCLPLWDDLRNKVREWCVKFNVEEGPVEEVIERRFSKNYHPAWSAAFILDPLYLMRDTSGKYLPPFKCLTQEQEKDVDRLITRLVSREEAHIALMELMKWRAEGLDPLYAQAVQVKQRDPVTGKMKLANPQSSRLVWETCLSEFKALGKVAVRLIFLHATSCGLKCNWSFMRWVYTHGHSRAAMDKAQKMIFIASHARLERRDFVNEEEKDAELFMNGEDDVLNEVFPDQTI